MIEINIYNSDVNENGTNIPVYSFKSIYKINVIGG